MGGIVRANVGARDKIGRIRRYCTLRMSPEEEEEEEEEGDRFHFPPHAHPRKPIQLSQKPTRHLALG